MTQPIGFKDVPGVLLPPVVPGGQRIDAIKEALRTFISRRPDDRIGVVVFSDHAYVVSPLTFDKEHLLGYFDLIDPQTLMREGMTAIGDGISMASFLLQRQSAAGARNKAIIVFTDGANNLGRDPVLALEDATAAGVRVHVVGVDLDEEQRVHPEVGRFITAIRKNGGQYYAADSRTELDAASREVDRIEKSSLTMKTYVRNEPIVQWLALPALAVLLIAVVLRAVPTFIGLH
jgi:Ca-activated chloride channel family protein